MEMVERRDTSVTRHAGGWIVLGGGLLLVCLWSAVLPKLASIESPEELYGTSPDHSSGHSVADAAADASTTSRGSSGGFPRLSIDINEASEAELSCVSGVGPTLARRIVEHRRRSGRFASLDELEKIPGVGPQLLTQLTSAIIPLPRDSPPGSESRATPACSPPADSLQLPEQLSDVLPEQLPDELRSGETTLAKQHLKKKTNEPLHD